MLTTRKRKMVGRLGRRGMSERPRRRVYTGGAVTRPAESRVFFTRGTQQMASGTRLGDWLGAALMLAAIAGWGTLLMLLGS
jgi:hypothetical protein